MTKLNSETITNPSEVGTEKYTQDLEFSDSSASSGKLPEYDNLNEFAQGEVKPSDKSETASEIHSETDSEMTEADAISLAGFGVEQISNYITENINAPIVIPDSQKEEIAKKGSALIRKYMPTGAMPDWLLVWKAEIEFGLAIGACAFSIYKQKLEHDKTVIEPAHDIEQAITNGD